MKAFGAIAVLIALAALVGSAGAIVDEVPEGQIVVSEMGTVFLKSPIALALEDGQGNGGSDKDEAIIRYHNADGSGTEHEGGLPMLKYSHEFEGSYFYRLDGVSNIADMDIYVSDSGHHNKLQASFR